MFDLGHELQQVHWVLVILYAIWILPIPKIAEMNIKGLYSLNESTLSKLGRPLSSKIIKTASVTYAIVWPWLLFTSIIVEIFNSIFPKPK